MLKAYMRSLTILGTFFICVAGVWGQEQYVADGQLPNNYMGLKNVSAYNYNDTLYVAAIANSICTVYKKRPQGYWSSDIYIIAWQPDRLDFLVSATQKAYLYNSSDHLFHYYDRYFIRERECPGKPKIDWQNNVHLLWRGAGDTLFYGYSTDTLRNFTEIDTLFSHTDTFFLITSPNDSLVCALLVDHASDLLYKYVGFNGAPIDFTSPDEVIGFSYDVNIFDITLDFQGNILMVVAYPWDWWGDYYVWSENHGLSFLRRGGDYVMENTNFELAFNPNTNEILITESVNLLYECWRKFYASTDNGNTWFESRYSPSLTFSVYGTIPRVFQQRIDYFYYRGYDPARTYYYPIPRDSIFNNLTAIDGGKAPLPEFIKLMSYPNPFNASTSINFNVPQAGYVRLEIFDISGRGIKTLLEWYIPAGSQEVVWNGTNQDNKPVSSGVYFCKLEINGHQSSVKKMLLLK
jgi:hypothetical protein